MMKKVNAAERNSGGGGAGAGEERRPLLEGALWKVSRRISGRHYWQKKYFICQGANLFCYKSEDTWKKRERPEKVYRVDAAEGFVEDTGSLILQGRTYHCVTLLYRSVTSGELKHLKLGTIKPEDAAKWRQVLLQARHDALNKSKVDRGNSEIKMPLNEVSSEDESIDPNENDNQKISMLSQDEYELANSKKKEFPTSLHCSRPITHLEEASLDTRQGNSVPISLESSPMKKGQTPSKSEENTYRRGLNRLGTCGTMPPDMDSIQAHLDNMRRMPESETDMFTRNLVEHDDDDDDASQASQEIGGDAESDPWRLVKVENGLRFFEDCSGEQGRVPCMKAVGRVRAPPDAVFKLLMDISRSRRNWDITFSHGRVLQTVDGHSDIIQLVYRPLTVWGLWPQPAPRDLCLRRYWRREEDGTYMILLRSHDHPDCPKIPGYVRANLAGGGFVISPLSQRVRRIPNQMEDSLVMQILEMAPGGWMHPRLYFSRVMYHQILLATGAIREAFDQMTTECLEKLWEEPAPDSPVQEQSERGIDLVMESPGGRGVAVRQLSGLPGIKGGSIGPVAVQSDPSGRACGSKASSSKALERRRRSALKSLVGQHGSMPHQLWPPHSASKDDKSLWGVCQAPHSLFKLRSKTYVTNKKKQTASNPLMELIDTDFFQSDKKINNTAGRKEGIVQKLLLTQESVAFIFAVNIQVQVQGRHYSMINYYACSEPPDPASLLGRFIFGGDDAFRNARFKMIPLVTKGSWVVQSAVGSTPFIVGGALKVDFHQGERYFEVDVNVGSSSVANTVLTIVAPCARNIVVDIAYVIQGDTEVELPELLLATTRIIHLNWEDSSSILPAEDFI